MEAFYDILAVPFGYILRGIYSVVGNYGISLLIFTLITRLLTVPTTVSQQRGMAKQQRLQPKIRRINEKYAGNKQKIQEETQALYQREGHNPMNAGCLPMLIQMPIIIGLMGVVYNPLRYALWVDNSHIEILKQAVQKILEANGETVVSRALPVAVIEKIQNGELLLSSLQGIPEAVFDEIKNFNFSFLGIPLGQKPVFKEFNRLWVVPVLSGLSSLATSFLQQRKQKKSNPDMANNPASGCMTFSMPLMSAWFAFMFPAGVGIYWIASNVFSYIQTVLVGRFVTPQKNIVRLMVAETIERRSREENVKIIAEKSAEKE